MRTLALIFLLPMTCIAQLALLDNTESAVVPNGLVAYWKMDVGGNMIYSSVGGIQGTNYGSTLTGGMVKGAMSFVLPSHLDVGIGSIGTKINGASVVTVSMWVNMAYTNNSAILTNLLFVGISANLSGFIISQSSGGFSAGARSVLSDSLQGQVVTGLITTNRWYQISAIFNFTTKTILFYTNSVLATTAGSLSFGNNNYTQGSPAITDCIGGWPANEWYSTAKIDELRIYNRALSTNEITQLYKFGH